MPSEEEEQHVQLPDNAFLNPAADALFKARTVLIYGEVNTKLARTVSAQLLALNASGDGPIRMIVHSQGGHVEAADTIFDLVRAITPEVLMIGSGWVASAGVHIYSSAKKQNRFALPNTRFMIHQPLGGARGQATDIEIEAEQIIKMRERLNRLLAESTGQPYDKIAKDTDRNHWMNAKEAAEYGLVHKVIDKLADVGK